MAEVDFLALASGIDVPVRDAQSSFTGQRFTPPSVLPGPLTMTFTVDRSSTQRSWRLAYSVVDGNSGSITGTLGNTSAGRNISHLMLSVRGNHLENGDDTPTGIDRLELRWDEQPVTFEPPVHGRPPKPSNLVTFVNGTLLQSTRPPVGGPGLLLMGGGAEVDAAFTQRAYPVNNGGDQSQTIANWKGTRLADAVPFAYQRGAVIGGTSAGMMVSGEWMYDPGPQIAVNSAQAVANPYRPSVILSTDLFDLPLGHNLVPEPHFANRDRMGRLLIFMARLRQDARTSLVNGIGLDEQTSLFIDADGIDTFQRFANAGNAYVLREDRRSTQRLQVAPGPAADLRQPASQPHERARPDLRLPPRPAWRRRAHLDDHRRGRAAAPRPRRLDRAGLWPRGPARRRR